MGCGASSENGSSAGETPPDLKRERISGTSCNDHQKATSASITVNEMTLRDYLRVEKEIAEAEIGNPVKPLDLKTEQLLKITEDVQKLEQNLKNLQQQGTAFGGKTTDAVETHKYFIENGISNELTPAQEKYMELLNKKEITQKELETSKKQGKELKIEISELEKKVNYLHGLYDRQDALLDKIFGGMYGSIQENQLEQELDSLENKRTAILEANYKWRQALLMIEHAYKQLSIAVQKWESLKSIPNNNLETRYSVASEARNNLVASSQNITGAHRYLEFVTFPYATPEEVKTLNKGTAYIFTDMQSDERYRHARELYVTTNKRVGALLQWFDQVIENSVMKDLHDTNEQVKEKTLELRRERVRLIKLKVEELLGIEIDLDETLRGRDVNAAELALAMLSDKHVAKVDGEIDGGRRSTPYQLKNEELAPVPSNSVIFGSNYDNYQNQIKELNSKHQEELQRFMADQSQNEQKMRGKLEEKLMHKRQSRAKAKIEAMQKSVL